MSEPTPSTQAQLQTAVALLQKNRVAEAEPLLAALANRPDASDDVDEWLARCYLALGLPERARAAIDRGLARRVPDPERLLVAANIHDDCGDTSGAIALLEQATRLDPAFAAGHNNLGNLLLRAGRPVDAEQAFRRAIATRPGYARALTNLAITLIGRGQAGEALPHALSAVRNDPAFARGHAAAALALMRLARHREAVAAAEQCLQRAPQDVDTWLVLARSQLMLEHLDLAARGVRRARELAPDRLDALELEAELSWQLGDEQRARAAWSHILPREPHKLGVAIADALALPEVYASTADLDARRQRYAQGLDRLLAQSGQFLASAPPAARVAAVQTSNFLLAYQGHDDRELQARYGRFLAQMLDGCLPPADAGRRMPSPDARRRIRIGFASAHFAHTTAGLYFRSWVTDLPRGRFEVFAFRLGGASDYVTDEIRARADHFFDCGPDFIATAEAIRAAALDLLCFPELGMNGYCFALAALRLAPTQVAGWGHPVTTGLPTVDYFVSCEEMEPPQAQQHYTETLRLLPGIGTRYRSATVALDRSQTRRRYGLPEGRFIYLVPQSLHKILPENDELVATVLAQTSRSTAVFFRSEKPTADALFMQRMHAALRRRGVDPAHRLVLLPKCPHDQYKRINLLSDVMLDTLHWSGGNTTLDSLSHGLPVVTLPGQFMRGRQSAAMLRLIGAPELIAANRDDYVSIAKRLATDPSFLAQMKQRVVNGNTQLFDDPHPVQAFAALIEEIVHKNAVHDPPRPTAAR
jgi:predicted O-linked N-acetylglucosamine transferase (SPINDLY family)